MTTIVSQKHPAKYSKGLLPIFSKMIPQNSLVLDPFGGTGERLKELRDNFLPSCKFFGIEIEYEFIKIPDIVICGNALYLPFERESIDVVCTSPAYGNRLADKTPKVSIDTSYKITYQRSLGRELSKDSGASLQWGDKYREFHKLAWMESKRVLKNGGFFILNIKDHIRKKERQMVTDWHIKTFLEIGFELVESENVETPSIRKGENYELRVPYESVIKFKKTLDKK